MDPHAPSADRPATAPSEFPGVAPPPPPITGVGTPRPGHGRSGASARPGGLAAIWPGSTTTAAEQEALGRGARKDVPRRSHSELVTGADRDPLAILARQAQTRVPELVPVRHARMAVSPFTFFRGAAAVMAADLAGGPTTPVTVQACGDAHLVNFGLFATPERHLAFDVNDFDETLPAPFEWDVKRLAASVAIAAADRGFDASSKRAATQAAVASYAESVAALADLDELQGWYTQVNVDELVPLLPKPLRKAGTKIADRARRHTSAQAVAKLTTTDGGRLRIVDDPPLIVHPPGDEVQAHVAGLIASYLPTLSSDRQTLLRRFRVVDVARKVVGVGSVGTRCYVVLLAANRDDTPLFLQVKEAEASVFEPFVGAAPQLTSGERVVAGQKLMQASSDIFLGWGTVGPHHFYVRQLRDMKGSVDVDALSPDGLVSYARSCGFALARAHARSGNATAISAYVGTGSVFVDAVTGFAVAYEAVNAADHAAFVAAIDAGRVEAAPLS